MIKITSPTELKMKVQELQNISEEIGGLELKIEILKTLTANLEKNQQQLDGFIAFVRSGLKSTDAAEKLEDEARKHGLSLKDIQELSLGYLGKTTWEDIVEK